MPGGLITVQFIKQPAPENHPSMTWSNIQEWKRLDDLI